jgi:hypothetical protein
VPGRGTEETGAGADAGGPGGEAEHGGRGTASIGGAGGVGQDEFEGAVAGLDGGDGLEVGEEFGGGGGHRLRYSGEVEGRTGRGARKIGPAGIDGSWCGRGSRLEELMSCGRSA